MKKFLQRILHALTKHKKKSAAVVAGGLIAGAAYGFYTPPPFAVVWRAAPVAAPSAPVAPPSRVHSVAMAPVTSYFVEPNQSVK